MTTPNIEGININTQINEIKHIFELKEIGDINSAVMTKTHQYEKIVLDMENSYKKDYSGKLSRLKKFFSSSKKQDYESFKFKVAEYIEKFKTIKEKVYNDLKNNKRIIAPDTASQKITQEIFFQQRKLESVDDEIDALNSAISKREEKIKLWRQGLHPARFDIDENKATKEMARLKGAIDALNKEIQNTISDEDKEEKEKECVCLKLEFDIYNTFHISFKEYEGKIHELGDQYEKGILELGKNHLLSPGDKEQKLMSLATTYESNLKKLRESQKANANKLDDDIKKAISKFIDHLKSKKEEDEKKREDLKKLSKEITTVIKGLKEKRKSFVDNNKDVPVLFSNLIKCLENCVARLQKLQKAFGKESSKKINASSTKQSMFGFAGPEPDSAAVSDSAARARAHVSLTESDKAKKSENVKKYNAAVKKFTWLRLVFSDSAKEKIENINKLAQKQGCNVKKLSITDNWTENYSKINELSIELPKLFYDSRIEFLSGEKEVPDKFQEIYDYADKYYKDNKDICDILCSNKKLEMRNLYIYDNNMGTELISGGKFKIPANYKYSQYLKCLARLIQTNQYNNSSSYTMNLQKCSDIINGKEVTILYDHDKGSWRSPYWVVVDNNGKSIDKPNAGETINKSGKNELAQKEVELVIHASYIAGGWLNINNFS